VGAQLIRGGPVPTRPHSWLRACIKRRSFHEMLALGTCSTKQLQLLRDSPHLPTSLVEVYIGPISLDPILGQLSLSSSWGR